MQGPPPLPAKHVPLPTRPIEVVSAIRPPQEKRLLWVPPGEFCEIAGRRLPGMHYLTRTALGWNGESSAILPTLQVTTSAGPVEDLSYYPTYESLTPAQRGIYIDWLARGRRDSGEAAVPTGYLFLFFYGIERRTLMEGDRDTRLWTEIFDLLGSYGKRIKSRSLASYFGDFLHFSAYSWGQESYSRALPALLQLQGKTLSETALTLALASTYERQLPMSWELAHLVAMNLENSRRSVVIERTGEIFRRMFQQRYEQVYPKGMPLKASKRQTIVRYRSGNPTLHAQHDSSRSSSQMTLTVPGVMGIMSQFKTLPAIWNQCIEDLSGYSRAAAKFTSAKSVSNQDRLKAYLALPAEIRSQHVHPLAAAMDLLLKECPQENGIHFVPVSLLAALLGISERATLTAGQSNDVAELLESLALTLSPHPRLLNLPLGWAQEIAVTPCRGTSADEVRLGGLLRLLFLAVLIASADGEIDDRELATFHSASGVTEDYARTQIAATEAVLVRDTHVASKLLPRISKSIPATERKEVFRLLVHIAGSDEVISSDENRLLRKIAKTFNLGDNALEDLLAEDAALRTVTLQQDRSRPDTPVALKTGMPVAAPAFSLDMERIAALTKETAEVVSILSKALAEEEDSDADAAPAPEDDEEETDEEEDAAPAPAAAIATPPSQPGISSSEPGWIQSLDTRYRAALLTALSTATTAAPVDLAPVMDQHHLMTDDFVDGVNAWSDEALGDFLLEESGPGRFLFHLELLPSH
ncbi:MAG: hypothetical protein JWO82_270 [Akkermansiaceae bacterium]|nr:hypothetical protein [Akkermansiaceae bacterium]